MTIVDDLLMALPPDRAVRAVHIGLHWTSVWLTEGQAGEPASCGLAATLPPRSGPGHSHELIQNAGHLHECSAHELAALARSEVGPERSVGWATINALLVPDEWQCVELNARDFLLEKGRDKRVAMVGHFPFVEKLRDAVSSLWVLELDPAPGDLPASAAPEVLPQADIIAVTSLTLLNDTFEELATLWRPEALVMLLGPSTPFTPLLFERGVKVLSGALVTDPQRVIACVSQGASFQQVKGVRLLTMVHPDLQL